MLLFFLLAAGIGGTLTALSLFLPEPGLPATSEPPDAPGPPAAPSLEPARLRLWSLPLIAVGVLGATLHLLDRSFVTTATLSLLVGIPTGLAGAWLIRRLS